MDLEQWIMRPKKRPAATVRLFCLPYAGGAASMFASWSRRLPEHVELCAVQLPGRENRLSESPRADLAVLAAELREVAVALADLPLVVFGHSMGALLGFELARDLRRHGRPEPRRLIVSAHRAAQLPRLTAATYALPREQLIKRMRQLGGTPEAILNHAEMMDLLLPILRADLELCDTYTYRPEPPLACPISAIGGIDDPETRPSQLESWREQTGSSFNLQLFAGGHFFLKANEEEVVQWIVQQIDRSERVSDGPA